MLGYGIPMTVVQSMNASVLRMVIIMTFGLHQKTQIDLLWLMMGVDKSRLMAGKTGLPT
jgi:hypothetical protein